MRKVAGRPTAEVLAGLLAGVLRGLAFPKRMSWDAWLDDGRGAFPFGRPIRWLVLLLDGAVVPFAIHALEGGAKGPVVVESGDATRGHRFLPKGQDGLPVRVRSFADLRARLRERFVLVDPGERLARIDAGSHAAGRTLRRPRPARGVARPRRVPDRPDRRRSRPSSAPLPPEVLETVLVHHQKSISLRDEAARSPVSRPSSNGDGAAAAGDRAGDGARCRGTPARRVLLPGRGSQARARGPRRGPGRGDLPPGPRHLPRQVGADGEAGRGHGAAGPAVRRRARGGDPGGAAREGRPRHADGARVPRAAGRDGRHLPRRRGRAGGCRHGRALALPPDRGRAGGRARGGLRRRGREGPRLRGGGARRQARHAGRLLRPRREPDRQPRPLRPAPRRPGRGARRSRLLAAEGREKAPDLEALLCAADRGLRRDFKQPADKTARASRRRSFWTAWSTSWRAEASPPTRSVQSCTRADSDAMPARRAPRPARHPRACQDPVDALRRAEALQRVRRERPGGLRRPGRGLQACQEHPRRRQPAAAVDSRAAARARRRAGLCTWPSEPRKARAAPTRTSLRGLALLRAPVGRFFDDVLVMAEDARVRGNRLALLNQTLSLFYRIADISSLGGTS